MIHCPLQKNNCSKEEKYSAHHLIDKSHGNMQEGKASKKEFLKWKLHRFEDEQFDFFTSYGVEKRGGTNAFNNMFRNRRKLS